MPTVEAVAGLALLDNRRAKAAYEELAPHITALHPDSLRSVRADLNVICSRAFAMLPRLRGMRAEAVEAFKHFDFNQFDSIEQRILAAYYANQMWLSSSSDKVDVAQQAQLLMDWRAKLLSASSMLVTFGLVAATPLQKIGSEPGYAALINDVAKLLGVLQRAGATALAKTPLTEEDLAVAERDVLELQTVLGIKEIDTVKREDAATLRLQAFTYLWTAFDWAYRAAYFLYGEAQADVLLPSLFPDYSVRKRKTSEAESEGPPAAGAGSGATPGVTPPATGPVVPTTVAPALTSAPIHNPTGLPLTDPLES